jgi:hypothetical protein
MGNQQKMYGKKPIFSCLLHSGRHWGAQQTQLPRLVILPAWTFAGLLACLRELLIKFAIADCSDRGVDHGGQLVERRTATAGLPFSNSIRFNPLRTNSRPSSPTSDWFGCTSGLSG